MTNIVYKYRLFCNEEQTYVFTYGATEPTLCPNDHANRTNISAATIVETISSQTVITDDKIPSNAYYKVFSQEVSIPTQTPGTVNNNTFTWVWDAYIWTVSLYLLSSMVGDELSIYVAKDTVIGLLTANASIGATSVQVSASVFNYLIKGLEISLYDPINNITEYPGKSITIDTTTNTVTFENALTQAFPAGSYFRFSMKPFSNIKIYNSGERIIVGRAGLKPRIIPAGTPVTIQYTNNTGTAKNLSFLIEMYHT